MLYFTCMAWVKPMLVQVGVLYDTSELLTEIRLHARWVALGILVDLFPTAFLDYFCFAFAISRWFIDYVSSVLNDLLRKWWTLFWQNFIDLRKVTTVSNWIYGMNLADKSGELLDVCCCMMTGRVAGPGNCESIYRVILIYCAKLVNCFVY